MPIIKRKVSPFELLASACLLLALAWFLFWVLDPIERLKRGRDSQRLSELVELREAIDRAEAMLTSTQGVPVSSASVGATRAIDGSGWLPLNLTGHLGILPIDPLNGETFTDIGGDAVVGEYQFISDGNYYVLRTHLEAEASREYYASDGNDNSWYELGDAPGLSTYFGL
jgi:hypothetical protein